MEPIYWNLIKTTFFFQSSQISCEQEKLTKLFNGAYVYESKQLKRTFLFQSQISH